MNESGGGNGGQAHEGVPVAPRVPGLVMLRRLGRGGHGEVWLAADLGSGERVAVKVHCRPADGPSLVRSDDPRGGPADDEAARLSREIALLKRIDHPHVIRLRRVVDLPDGGRALVMDLAAGGNLADLVARRGPLDPSETCTVVVPLAQTLAELHSRGLVHGDLSPGNVLFTGDGQPMVADLGCAAVLGDPSTPVWGSDGFVDPGRTGSADPAHDVYALGALLRFMLAGDSTVDLTAGPAEVKPQARALLALADLCTDPDPARRPRPNDVATTALAATPPAPVRLLLASGSAGPARIRPSAAERGWTRAADRQVPTAATTLPPTAVDLGFDAALAGRTGGAIRVTSRAGSAAGGAAAVTRRRTPPSPGASSPGTRSPMPGSRRSRRSSSRASTRSGRQALLIGFAVIVATAGAWFLLGAVRPVPAESTTATATAAPTAPVAVASEAAPRPKPITATGSITATDDGRVEEPLEQAVPRLAAGRAAAFAEAKVPTLVTVDEPGSPAMASDADLVRRLNAKGLRLDGLSFGVSEVRRLHANAGVISVMATVTTSAHRQVSVSDNAVRATVPASSPRRVILILVRASDGRRWLVREVRDDTSRATGDAGRTGALRP